MSNYKLAFTHIEKTAGTSFIHILRHNLFLRYIDVRPMFNRGDGIFKAEDLKIILRLNPYLIGFGGHSVVPFSDLESVCPIKYITIFREPRHRFISHYRDWISIRGKNLTMNEFCEIKEMHNLQVKKIAGEPNVHKAIDILENKFLTYGIVENFPDFINALAESLGMDNFENIEIIRNVNKKNVHYNEDILNQYNERIMDLNSIDIILYNYIKNKISDRINKKDSQSITKLNRPSIKMYLDFVYRKLYVEPFSSLIRKKHGMSARGSY